MKTLLSLLTLMLLISGCGVVYEESPNGDSLYVYGSYGWIVNDYEVTYVYDTHYSDVVYFETPYLDAGCLIHIDIFDDYNDAFIGFDGWGTALAGYNYYYPNDSEYTYEVLDAGYHRFYISDLHPSSSVRVSYSCFYSARNAVKDATNLTEEQISSLGNEALNTIYLEIIKHTYGEDALTKQGGEEGKK